MQTPQKDNPSTLTPAKSGKLQNNPSVSKSSRPETAKVESPPPKMKDLSPKNPSPPSGRGRRKTRKTRKTRRVRKVNGR